jgi:hypothetical protein
MSLLRGLLEERHRTAIVLWHDASFRIHFAQEELGFLKPRVGRLAVQGSSALKVLLDAVAEILHACEVVQRHARA